MTVWFLPAFSYSSECMGEFKPKKNLIDIQVRLNAIRNSREEPRLKKEGFSPSYYASLDQAREFNEVQKYLQEINANSEHTHIPYFANQVEKTLANFEKGFMEQNKNNDRFPDMKKRLQILKAFKEEAKKRVKNRRVTYDWWANFNFRLVILGTDKNIIRNNLKTREYSEVEEKIERLRTRMEEAGDFNEDGFIDKLYAAQQKKETDILDFLKTHEDMVKALSSVLEDYSIQVGEFLSTKAQFPKIVLFFSTDDFGIMAFNRMRHSSYFVGVSGKNMSADGSNLSPLDYFLHDINHAVGSNKEVSEEVVEKLKSISKPVEREGAELALFMYEHEFGTSMDELPKTMREVVDRFRDSKDLGKFEPMIYNEDFYDVFGEYPDLEDWLEMSGNILLKYAR